MRNLFQNKLGLNSKTAAINIILVANALVWYYCAFRFLRNINEIYAINVVEVNLVSIILAAVLSTKIIQKIENRQRFLIYWTTIGIFLSLLPLAVQGTSFITLMSVSAVMGAYFGFGIPVFMGYYAASTETENRARLSGVTIFIVGVMSASLGYVAGQDATATSIVLVVWRLFGLVSLISLKSPQVKINKIDKVSFKGLVKSYSVLLYFVPWLMFSLINNFAIPILNNLSLPNNAMAEAVLAGISALFFGFMADFIGRKRLLLIGFVFIGLGYAALGVFSQNPALSEIASLFYTVADGVAFGAFSTLFLLTIWGDLADKRDGEKFYVIGFLPWLLSNFIQVSVGQIVTDNVFTSKDATMLFSFFSFFLFAAVLPLYLAPETLPEKAMKDRNLKSYLEKAQKIAEKEVAKNRRGNKEPEQEVTEEKKLEEPQAPEEEKSPEYEEAEKLAQQYY
jgi:MFS family permease